MVDRLKDKVAVITGGASGIGAAAARLFLGEGASVLLADINPVSDPELNEIIPRYPGKVEFLRTDASKEAEIQAAMAKAFSLWGRLNIAMACAGITNSGGSADATVSDWDVVMGVNARGTFLTTKHAIPHMLRSGGGAIINLSSVWGSYGAPGYAAYCASKGAIRNFTKVTALEYASQNIRANSLHPGVIDTPGLGDLINRTEDPTATRSWLAALQPAGAMGRAEDIAWGAVYLASDEARFVSGAELAIDLGLAAQ